jgi:hypothetical protein
MHRTFPLVLPSPAFNAIVARISGFLNVFPFASMGTGARPHRLYAGHTWDRFAISPFKFASFIDRPTGARLLRVLADGCFCLVPRGKAPAGFVCFPVRGNSLTPDFIATDLMIRSGLASDMHSLDWPLSGFHVG